MCANMSLCGVPQHISGCQASDRAYTLTVADESDDEQEATAAMPSARISTSMVNQATAHLHRDGR